MTMGSLPNLRDLEREVETIRDIPKNPIRPHIPFIMGLKVNLCNPSRAKAIRHTRSMGQYTNISLNTHYHHEDISTSPLSTKSTRSSCTIHHHINNNLFLRRCSKHRDSLSSSAGTSSVRRLIAVVRSTSSKSGPIYSRGLLFRNFAALCLGHAMVTAAMIPFLTLQGSISVWLWPPDNSDVPKSMQSDYDLGSLLLSTLFLTGAISTLGNVFIINKLGTNWSLMLTYGGCCLFLGLHLYPNIYSLIPAYIFMGLCMGPLVGARVSSLMTLATKLTYVMTEEEEDEMECSHGLKKTEIVVYKLARGLQIAQDFGLIAGSISASFLVWYTKNHNSEVDQELDVMFAVDNGEKVCGSSLCPLSISYSSFFEMLKYSETSNSTNGFNALNINCKTGKMLISVFLGFCVMGVAVTAAFMDRIKVYAQKETTIKNACIASIKLMQAAFKDTRLQLAAPLSVFIGLEQGFIYADFTKYYVACSMGLSNISLVFLSLGLLQSVAAFTLSLILQHLRRHAIIGVGFIFQSCLLLVLFLWKPSKEDPALFYVVPAAWGVCNVIWETLSFSYLVSVYPESWQAPIAQCYFFRYIGLAIAFGMHGTLCNSFKLYGLAAAMLLAVGPYTWLELKTESKRKLKAQLANL